MADYLPASDTGLQAWAANFYTYANVNLVDLGLAPLDLTA